MALNWFSRHSGRRHRSAVSTPSTAAAGPLPAIDSGTHMADGQPLSWPDVVRQLGQEVAMSLNDAAERLDRLNRLEPSLVRSLAPVTEAVERARQAGMAAQHVARLSADPPPQHRELLSLADVVRAVLTARGDWLARRHIDVRQALTHTQVFADSSTLYMLVDELVQWAGHLATGIAMTVDKSARGGQPRLRVSAWCDPAQVPEPAWRSIRWTLWHQLARTLGASAELNMRQDHVRVTVTLPSVTDEQLAHSGDDAGNSPSSVSAMIQGCRVLLLSASAQRRAQYLQALAGYGLILDGAETAHEAERRPTQHLPDAVIYDGSIASHAVERLREQLERRSGAPIAFIEIHDQPGSSDFHASTIGSVSTGHVSTAALRQSLGPALVFELCKVL